MRIIALLFVLLFSLSASAQAPMSLSECIEMAWQNNLGVKQSELALDASESQLLSAKADVLPNLNGFATHNYNWGQRIDPFTNQFANTRVQSNSFGLQSNITLFNGFQNYQAIQGQEAGMESAKFNLEAQKNSIALTVAGLYLQIILTDQLVEAAELQRSITEAQLERVKKLVEAGAANVGDQYELEAQLARDKSNLQQRQNDKQLAELQLKQAMILPAGEELALVKPGVQVDAELRLESSDLVYGMAEGTMPEVKSAQFNLQQMEHRLRANKSGWYPSLVLSGSIGTGYSGLRTDVESITSTGNQVIGFTESGESVLQPTFDPVLVKVPFSTQLNDNFNQFIGLSLNVPIFNRYGTSNAVQQARINQTIAELNLEQEKLALRQRIESARNDAMAARALYLANEESRKASEKAFEFAQARYEAGALNVTLFNTSKNNLLIAQVQSYSAQFDYLFKVKVLDFYMGKPLSVE